MELGGRRKSATGDISIGVMARARVAMDVGRDGVAVITMSNPPINALAPSSNLSDASLFFLPFF